MPATKVLAVLMLCVPAMAADAQGAGSPVPVARDSTVPQSTPASAPPSECWRFAFGRWDPPLDWRAAGHIGEPTDFRAQGPAVGGPESAPQRDLAAWSETARDTALILYPSWWPAGIAVRLPRSASPMDTVRGMAIAFVADGRRANPVSRVVAFRRGCGTALP